MPIYPDVKLDGGDTYLDFMFGVRYMGQISEKWCYILRADGSGVIQTAPRILSPA